MMRSSSFNKGRESIIKKRFENRQQMLDQVKLIDDEKEREASIENFEAETLSQLLINELK